MTGDANQTGQPPKPVQTVPPETSNQTAQSAQRVNNESGVTPATTQAASQTVGPAIASSTVQRVTETAQAAAQALDLKLKPERRLAQDLNSKPVPEAVLSYAETRMTPAKPSTGFYIDGVGGVAAAATGAVVSGGSMERAVAQAAQSNIKACYQVTNADRSAAVSACMGAGQKAQVSVSVGM